VLRILSLGGWGSSVPNSVRMSDWRSQNDFEAARSAALLRVHEMLTIEPGPTPEGRRREGNSIKCTDCDGKEVGQLGAEAKTRQAGFVLSVRRR